MATPAQYGQTQAEGLYSKCIVLGLMLRRRESLASQSFVCIACAACFSPYSRLAMPSGRMSTPTALTDTPAGVFAMKQGDEDTTSGPAPKAVRSVTMMFRW